MNKGIVPANSVSKQEIDVMQRTRDILKYADNQPSSNVGPYTANFREIPNPPQRPTPNRAPPIMPTYIQDDGRAGVDAMRNIMESLSGVFGEEASVLTQEDLRKPSMITEERAPTTSRSYTSGASWDVTVELDTTGSRIYEVKNENREPYNNVKFSVFEAAYASAKILNRGKSTSRINDLIELDEDFSTYRQDATSTKKNYNKSVKLNESAAADVFAKRYKKAQSSMTAVHETIKDILKNI